MSDTTLQSHMPILEFLLDRFEINTALEFGCGLYSTPLLLQKCEHVESREMNSEEWSAKVNDHFWNSGIDTLHWIRLWVEGPTAAMEIPNDASCFDLVLCDGHGDTRAEQAVSMIDRAGIIVIHDSQHMQTIEGLFDLIARFNHYARIDFNNWRKPVDLPAGDVWPWTTVLVNDPDRAKVITDWRDAG